VRYSAGARCGQAPAVGRRLGRMLRQLASLATRRLLLRELPKDSLAPMKNLTLASALLLAASPAAAQVATSQQSGGQSVQSAATQAPTTGVFCIEEMTATFCNVPSGPSEGGYGSRGVSTLSSGSGTSSVSASSGAGGISSSIPPCSSEPPFNELCN
jgi:hypothetical protein